MYGTRLTWIAAAPAKRSTQVCSTLSAIVKNYSIQLLQQLKWMNASQRVQLAVIVKISNLRSINHTPKTAHITLRWDDRTHSCWLYKSSLTNYTDICWCFITKVVLCFKKPIHLQNFVTIRRTVDRHDDLLTFKMATVCHLGFVAHMPETVYKTTNEANLACFVVLQNLVGIDDVKTKRFNAPNIKNTISIKLIIHRRCVAKRGGCFQQRLFVCLFVCVFVCLSVCLFVSMFVRTITSERLN